MAVTNAQQRVQEAWAAFVYELWHGDRHGSAPWLLRVQRKADAYAQAEELAVLAKLEEQISKGWAADLIIAKLRAAILAGEHSGKGEA